MSSDPAVRVDAVSKCYHMYERPEDRLKQILWRGRRQFYTEFWAVRDVSFEVARGETVGIVGRNGSGKSTLLQMIAGTLTPTTGSGAVHGRVAPLLELGTGFNPEFTGRENVFMNGAILGLSQADITARFDEIAAFADIGPFLEQPVKHYSSGMVVRLAFAVATAVNPEVLILDEALAVGDARFQLACFERLQRMLDGGMTLLFVSHDGNAVKRLCHRALVLEGGSKVFEGVPNEALNFYSHLLFRGTVAPRPEPAADARDETPPAAAYQIGPQTTAKEYRYGSDKGAITGVVMLDERGAPGLVFETGAPVVVRLAVDVRAAVDAPVLAMTLKNAKGVEVYGTNTLFQEIAMPPLGGGEQLVVDFIQRMSLMPDTYFLSLGFVELVGDEIAPIDRRYDVLEFQVTQLDRSFGIANLHSQIVIRTAGEAPPLGDSRA